MPLEIGYWAIRGLGAPLRAMAMYADEPFEAKCYDLREKPDGGWDLSCWYGPKEALKKRNALMNLPYVVDGDIVVSQSNACLVYLGEKFGLLGATASERIECEQLLCEIMDLRNAMVKEFYGSGELVKLFEVASLAKLNAWLEAKGATFLVTATPTAPDFHLCELLDQLLKAGEVAGVAEPLGAYPALRALHGRFFALERMQKYNRSHLAQFPINNKMAKFGATPSGAPWVPGQAQDWSGDGLAPAKNAAFVFIKPHAVTDKVISLVKGYLAGRGVRVLAEGRIAGEQIDEKKLIDQHYYAIASKATILKPAQLNVPADKFKAQFGLEWANALATGDVVNAMDACARFGCTADELDAAWGAAKKAKQLVKFGGGFYCGLIEMKGKKLYVFNGFFMSMRSKFTAPGTSIYYFSVEWAADSLAWADFRARALGPTDPADAPADALRGMVLADWEALGLSEVPNVGDNGVHASASPFEALAERMNWLGASAASDSFGKACLAAGIDEATLSAWSVDPQVNLPGGSRGSLFDAVEDTDAEECLAKLLSIKACA